MIQRILEIERRIGDFEIRLGQILQRLTGVEQATAKQWGQQGGFGGGGVGVYVAITGSGGIAAASSGPPSGTPGSTSLDVYQLIGGAYTKIATGATVYNPYLSATAAAAKVITVAPNGDGTYTLLGESCT